MSNLKEFRESLFELTMEIPVENRHLFEPFVSFGNPFDSKIFFVGANGVLDDDSRPMLHFLNYWSDEQGFDFKTWHYHLANLPKGLSKTRINADKMISMLDQSGLQNKVLSTNVFSIGSARLANLKNDYRSVAPFKYLIENLKPEVLFVFGSDAKKAIYNLWPNQIELKTNQIDGIEPFQLNLNGKNIQGIFTKHLCFQTGNQNLVEYVSEILRIIDLPQFIVKNQNSYTKQIKKMEKQKVIGKVESKSKFEIEPAFQVALDLFEQVWRKDSSFKIPSNSNGKPFQIISLDRKRTSIPILNASNSERPMSLDATQEFFFERVWIIKGVPYNKDSNYGDLTFSGGFAKFLKELVSQATTP